MCGDEVIVAEVQRKGVLEVFSLTGQPRRTLRADFGAPDKVLLHDNRLYVANFDRMRESLLVVLDPQDGTLHQRLFMPEGHFGEEPEDVYTLFFRDGELHVESYVDFGASKGPKVSMAEVRTFIRVFAVCPSL